MSSTKYVKDDTYNDKDFVCLYPRCFKDRLCELNMEAFGFTLDSLLIECSREMKIIYFLMVVIIFSFGLFNNFCSFVTFKRPTPAKRTGGGGISTGKWAPEGSFEVYCQIFLERLCKSL